MVEHRPTSAADVQVMIDDSPGDVSEAARRSSRVTSCQLARALLTDIFGKSRSRSPHAADRQWAVCVLRTSHHLDGFLSPSLRHLLRAICLDIVARLPLGAMQVALVSSHASVPLQHPKMNKICCQTRRGLLKWSLRLCARSRSDVSKDFSQVYLVTQQ